MGLEKSLAELAGGGLAGIYAIDGMAGIGKTTFAVHAAHRLAGRFPDGSSSSHCTRTPPGIGRSTRPMPWRVF
jgi:hypothetical protein